MTDPASGGHGDGPLFHRPDVRALSDGTFVHARDGAVMAFVPAVAFLMGRSDDDPFAKPHEIPQRIVTLSSFLIDVFSVTTEQYRLFLEDGGYGRSEYWEKDGWEWIRAEGIEEPLTWRVAAYRAPHLPVTGVSWHEARAYCRWAGRRLPTEAEWELAARGTDGRPFPWGEAIPDSRRANFDGRVGGPTPVDAYVDGRSPFGCFDMAGNVSNWCADWYWRPFYRFCVGERIDRDPVLDDRLEKDLGVKFRLKVERGGGFSVPFERFEQLSCTDKLAWIKTVREPWHGFRAALSVA